MKRQPTFTVVMPAYNAAATVAPAIRSVLAQTREDWEMYVVDDGSQDDTVERVLPFTRSDPRVHLVEQPNLGPGAARNAAIRSGRGRLVSMIDSTISSCPTTSTRWGPRLTATPPLPWPTPTRGS